MNSHKIKTLLSFILLLLIYGCAENISTPSEPLKSPREFDWTADTLAYPNSYQTMMKDIWASGPDDIYVCGHNDGVFGKVYHYDGNEWSPVDFTEYFPKSFDVYGVHGFSWYNVWLACSRADVVYDSGDIIEINYTTLLVHYNGFSWEEFDPGGKSALSDIWGSDPNNIYACGQDGLVYHYDGIEWEADTVDLNATDDDVYGLYRMTGDANNVYMLGEIKYKYSGGSKYYLLSRESNNWIVKDSLLFDSDNNRFNWGVSNLYIDYDGTLYSGGPEGVFVKNGKDWTNVLYSNYIVRSIDGNGQGDLIAACEFGKLYHYDGAGWALIERLDYDELLYTRAMYIENEIYVVANTLYEDTYRTIIFHGK